MSSVMEKAYMAETSEGPNRGRTLERPDGSKNVQVSDWPPPWEQVSKDQFPVAFESSKGHSDGDWSRGTSPLRGPTIPGPSAIGVMNEFMSDTGQRDDGWLQKEPKDPKDIDNSLSSVLEKAYATRGASPGNRHTISATSDVRDDPDLKRDTWLQKGPKDPRDMDNSLSSVLEKAYKTSQENTDDLEESRHALPKVWQLYLMFFLFHFYDRSLIC